MAVFSVASDVVPGPLPFGQSRRPAAIRETMPDAHSRPAAPDNLAGRLNRTHSFGARETGRTEPAGRTFM